MKRKEVLRKGNITWSSAVYTECLSCASAEPALGRHYLFLMLTKAPQGERYCYYSRFSGKNAKQESKAWVKLSPNVRSP